MIFNSIKLKNFRQYKGSHEYFFSNPESGKKMTLIVAKNGIGKTTFLQAFRYCFYGANANYLKLPKSDELLTNTLVDDLKQLDDVELMVEVNFTHKGINYIATRTQRYVKKNKKMLKNSEAEFVLLYSTNNQGHKTLDPVSSQDRIYQIIPPGLSHIFMFDGERIEKRIESNDYKKELKESVLGILDLKKMDYLIQLIGSESRSRSILGYLSGKITHSTKEERDVQSKYTRIQKDIEKEKAKKEKRNDDLEAIKKEIKKYRTVQKEIDEKKDLVNQLEAIEKEITRLDDDLEKLGDKYIMLSGKAITAKLLLSQKGKYDQFIQKRNSSRRFYQYLHVDTLTEILDRHECLCGNPIEEDSEAFKRIKELYKTALPIESAHHLNKIADTFSKVLSLKDKMSELQEIRENITEAKSRRRTKEKEAENKRKLIREKEIELGESTQRDIEKLQERKFKLGVAIGKSQNYITERERIFKKVDNEYKAILHKNDHNKKVRNAIDDIKKIKEQLKKRQQAKDEHARRILSKNYNNNFESVIVGDYSIFIDDKYNLSIIDNGSSKDVTSVMSTGQSVIVTLSFIKSLIETASEISLKMDRNESYGVIMDAALSNVDETHINNLCRNNLNTLEQLIFLSFKRQLRHEMYSGIIENVGKAYYLDKREDSIISKEIQLDELDEFIHRVEDNDE
jgi:DNA sulfur modification protein DndD